MNAVDAIRERVTQTAELEPTSADRVAWLSGRTIPTAVVEPSGNETWPETYIVRIEGRDVSGLFWDLGRALRCAEQYDGKAA